MKHTVKTLVVLAALGGLSACDTMGDQETAPPYAMERTATHEGGTVMAPPPAPMPEPAPQCKPCEDCSAWEARALQAEKDLAMCQEATSRVRDAYRDELKK